MIKFDELDLKSCKTNRCVSNKIVERLKEVNIDDLIKEVSKKFYKQEDTTRAVFSGLRLNMNTYLYGKGGYGKTEVIKTILKILNIPYYVINGYKDMPVEALLGVPNMKKLLDDSKYELNFSDSIFRFPGILIGEEFGDILPATAAALKDILSERGFRDGDIKIESLVSTMIITTNTSPDALSDDESKKAFYDGRFPIKHEVRWGSHRTRDYYELLRLYFPKKEWSRAHLLATIFEEHNKKGSYIVTPRKALEVFSGYLSMGMPALNVFDINMDKLTEMREASAIELEKVTISEMLDICNKYLKSANVHTAGYILNALSSIKIPAEIMPKYLEVMRSCSVPIVNGAAYVPDALIDAIDNLRDDHE